ncbi:MAG: hypothetical protein R6W82_10440 [bacterium]
MSRCRRPQSLPLLLALVLTATGTGRLDAQEVPEELLPRPVPGTVSVSLLGGWGSWSQTSINSTIRRDNLLLTAPVDSNGAGLGKGLESLNDGIALAVEARLRLDDRWSLVGGVMRLADSSRRDFLYDPGSGPQQSFLSYRVQGWPIYLGAAYGFTFTTSFSYEVSAAAVYFPRTTLDVEGSLGGLVSLDQEGTAAGVGALFRWGGTWHLTDGIGIVGGINLRLGKLGGADQEDGTPIVDAYGRELEADWSGVDILLGVRFGFLD